MISTLGMVVMGWSDESIHSGELAVAFADQRRRFQCGSIR
jgi:hypothetical protein